MREVREEEYIIQSLLDIDFYKFTMGQVVFKEFPDVQVKYEFKCRTRGVNLLKHISMADLKRELDHALTLRPNNSELHYLRGTNEYGERMFSEDYLQFFAGLQLPKYKLWAGPPAGEVGKDQLHLEFSGPWATTIYWETIALAIVNELYFRSLMSRLSTFEREVVWARGATKLWEKIQILREHPEIVFTEFGTRRRAARYWQDHVVDVLNQECPKGQFRGTSNVFLAMKYGLLPMGTKAHEMMMALAGMADTDEAIRRSPMDALDLWERHYGEGLYIALPDTFGTASFLEDMDSVRAARWRGFRQDSGDPFEFGERVMAFYAKHGIDAREKMIIFSDGLDVAMMVKLVRHFQGRIKVSFGWGTNLTNDIGFDALSLVIKLMEVNGCGTVKLSDNTAKAMGRPQDVEHYIEVFDYTNTASQATKY